ncbi:MAG: cation transporter [Alphaproteobacteria bacterium]|nr:cation transporter [Alphaproteobacteria bacterium]
MSHSHSHGHAHAHGHGDHASRNLGLAFALNLGFTLVELVGAWWTGSAAIAADAVHDLGDSLALAFAWGMQGLSGKGPSSTFSYGLRRLSLVGAFVNAMVLVIGGALVLIESVPRLWTPGTPNAQGMLGLAVLGVLVNGAAVLRVRGGGSLNERVVMLHLLEDVLGWVAVLIVSVVMLFVDLPVLDPLLAVGITCWVLWNAVGNLRRTIAVFLQAVPEGVDLGELRDRARAIPGVVALRHVHVWSQEGDSHVLTGDLVVETADLAAATEIRHQVADALADGGIGHCTLQLVPAGLDPGAHAGHGGCSGAPDPAAA